MHKKLLTTTLITLCIVFLPLTALAQSDGIPLQKDVFLEWPITTTEDLPDQITFNLYDSKTAITPIAAQTFPKGQYTVDFEFRKFDGVTSGNVARIKTNFTSKLNISNDPDASTRIKEIWVGIEVAGTEVGDRTQVADETLVQLLLASDASIATYLTLVYEGDDNPITTIYKNLPISSLSSDGSEPSLNSYFSALSGMPDGTRGDTTRWNNAASGGVYITSGRVGIGTNDPTALLEVKANGDATLAESYISSDGPVRFQLNSDVDNDGTPNSDVYFLFNHSQGGKFYSFGVDDSDGDKFKLTGRNGFGGDVYLTFGLAGRVGIGTTNPTALLEVKANGDATLAESYISSDGPVRFQLNSDVDNDGTPNSDVYFLFNHSQGGKFYSFGVDDSDGDKFKLTGRNGFGGDVYFTVDSGNMGIGTTAPGTYKLAVEGTIGCRELVVTTASWSDFVFKDDYKLPTLSEVEDFIVKNRHLPGIPNEKEVEERGVSVGNISSKLLQKIEELTLYIIALKKENVSLKEQIDGIRNQLEVSK